MATTLAPPPAVAPSAAAPARAGAAPAPSASAGPPRRRTWGLAYLAWGAAQALAVLALRWADPRFFWLDDSQTQFGPVVRWLGGQLEGGRPPLVDPEQGMAGNFTTDMQYGVMDPLHWLWQALAAETGDVLVMAQVFSAVCLVSVGAASLWLMLHHGVRPALAVPSAVALSLGGFALWYGSAWWPMLWSTAVLPWVWVAWASRRWPGAVLAGVATWAVLASGNPYAVPFAVLVVVGQLAETAWRARSPLALLTPAVLARVLASSGGLLLAMPTLLTTLETTPAAIRQGADPLLGNAGFGVPSLLDVLVGGPTLLGITNAWSGELDRSPALAGALLSLPLLALVGWRAALRARGVPTALLLVVAAGVATQLPTTVALFRYPLRYTVVLQLALGLLAVLAVTAAPRLGRHRLAVAAGLVVVQGLLSWSRTPVFWRWHLLAGVVALVALAGAVLLLRRRAAGSPPAAPATTGGRHATTHAAAAAVSAVLVLAVGSVPLLGLGMMHALQGRAVAQDLVQPQFAGLAFRNLFPGSEQGTTLAAFRDRAYDPGAAFTTYKTAPEGDRGWASGIQGGSSNLLASMRTGTGSLAVWQEAQNSHLPRDYQGNLVGDPSRWVAPAGDTGQAWVDVASQDRVVVQAVAPAVLLDHFTSSPLWREVPPADGDPGWREFDRTAPLPGRLTWASGTTVAPTGWVADLGRSGQVEDAWTVSTGDAPGRLVTRVTAWPGYTATLDGRPLEVGSLDGALVAFDLPAGLSGARLELTYAPLGDRYAVPLFVTGAALVALAGLLAALGPALVASAAAALGPRVRPVVARRLGGRSVGQLRAAGAQAARFFAGSLAGLAVDLVVFSVGIAAGLPPWAANVVSSSLAVVTVYLLVTRYVFAARASRRTFTAFALWYALSIVVFSATIDGVVALTGWAPIVAKVATLPLSFGANFLASRRIFRDPPAAPTAPAAPAAEDAP